MSVLAIELNDAGILAVHESRPKAAVTAPSPGFAVLDGDNLLTGEAAFRRSRLKPRWTANRFWETLETTNLPRPFPRRLTHADLVHAHLDSLWKSVPSVVEDVILAVPGWYTDEQLGLILGIARSCGIPVHGMIDTAVAASKTVAAGENRIYVDIFLHRTAATTLQGGPELQRGRIEVHPRLGLVTLWDGWVKLIANLFVRKTRFDPLHIADTEQSLYMSLPGWLDRLGEAEVTRLTMEAAGKEYSLELYRDEVIECVASAYEEIYRLVTSLKGSDENATLLLSHRLSRLPGLVELLSENSGVDVISLRPTAAATGALQAKDLVLSSTGGEELTFVTRLPLNSPGSCSRPVPTHVLQDGIARPIPSEPFFIGETRIERQEDRVIINDVRSFINGRKVEGRSILYAGDRLRVGSVEVLLIKVME